MRAAWHDVSVVPVVLALAMVLLAARPLQDPPPPLPPPVPTVTPAPTPLITPTPAPDGAPDLALVSWRTSRAIGPPWHGRLVNGVQLPELGEDFFTWDPIENRIPDRPWRRWGTDRLVRTVLTVIHEYRTARDGVQRVGIMDLSRPHGGVFGRRYGGLGHASHQNGLDADILYPRKDGLEARAVRPSEVDRRLAQDLVDRFVAAGAVKVFVGPHLHLHGPRDVVVPLVYHDDHLHVRIGRR
jgi:murein endopeptidase